MYKPYIHYDLELEKAIVGAISLESTAFNATVGILLPKHFHEPLNEKIYAVCKLLWEDSQQIDIISIIHAAKKPYPEILPELPYYLSVCQNKVTGSIITKLERNCLLLRQMYIERKLLLIKTENYEGDAIEKAMEIKQSINEMLALKSTNDWSDSLNISLAVHQHMDAVENLEYAGVQTGFRSLDLITGGYATGLYIIAARTSVGKSAFMGCCALNQVKAGLKVGIISLEMPVVQLGTRMASIISDVEFYKIFRNRMDDEREKEKVFEALESLANYPLYISDQPSVDANDIRAKASLLIKQHGLDILYVDYIQLVEGINTNKNFNREQEVSKISRSLKNTAMEFNIPIIALAQINREAEKATDKKPQLHHMRESGAIEQDSDGVLIIHRDFKSGILQDKNGNSTEHEADIIIAKWRNGELADIKIGFDGKKMKFYDKISGNIPFSNTSIPIEDDSDFSTYKSRN